MVALRTFARSDSAIWHLRLTRLLSLLALLGLVAPPATARVQQAPGSRVAIDLPDAYAPATQFSGFVNEALGVSLIIMEMPAQAYAQLAQGMTAEALATRGVRNAVAGTLNRQGQHVYMRGGQASPAGEVAKFILVIGDTTATALITANVPQAALDQGKLTVGAIEQALASATMAATAPPARDLFRLSYMGPFKPAGSALGTARMYDLGNKGKGPLLVIAPSIDRRPITDLEGHAERVIATIAKLKDVSITGRRSLQVSQQPAIELTATAKDATTHAEQLVYQVVVTAKEGGYLRLVGQAPIADQEKMLPEFRRIVEGLEILP